MLPEPFLLSRSGLVPRLLMQLAASALLTAFYTPGGAAGWALDLVLRFYLAVIRRAPGRLPPPLLRSRWGRWGWSLAAMPALVPVRTVVRPASRLSDFVEK